jgi:uncharacterized membrane protein YdjX (TVP38/TMEM64 family)
MITTETTAAPGSSSNTPKLLAFVLLIAAMGIAFLFLPLGEWSTTLREQIRAMGWLAPAAYVLLYIAFTVFLIPPTVLSFLSGSLFGWSGGVALTLLGGNSGALVSFLLARTVMRKRVEEWAGTHPRFAAVDKAIAENGFKIVLLMRFSPLFPFAMTNYLLGVTRLPVWKYVLATLLGMPPITCIVVYLGTLPAEVAAEWDNNRWILWLLGVVTALAAGALLTIHARKAMDSNTVEIKS